MRGLIHFYWFQGLRVHASTRAVNSRTDVNLFPLPRIEELIDHIGNAKVGYGSRLLASSSRYCFFLLTRYEVLVAPVKKIPVQIHMTVHTMSARVTQAY